MFTGIVETTARIMGIEHGKLILERPTSFASLQVGQSIAVGGVCLTVVAFDATSMEFDVVPETLSKTTFGSKKAGDMVNLERALVADGRFEGHIVQGHVEGVASIAEIQGEGDGKRIMLAVPEELARFVIPKGSVAIDGVSLTVAAINDQNICSIALIPHTIEQTTLGALRVGDQVHIETDILVRALLQAKN